LLIKVGQLFADKNRSFSTSYNPRNIVFTRSFDVAFMLRILPDTPLYRTIYQEFPEYKALVLSILQEKFSFEELVRFGPEVLSKDSLFAEIIKAQTPGELEKLLMDLYDKSYQNVYKNRIAFNANSVKAFSWVIVGLFSIAISALAYFVYENYTETSKYGVKMRIYESYYAYDSQTVVELSNKLKDQDMETQLKQVVTEALISTKDPANLQRGFYLDKTRQIEILEILITLQQYDLIAALSTDNPHARLYVLYYGKEYDKAIALANDNPDLRNNVQVQILLAQIYVAAGDYVQAENILKKTGDTSKLLEAYKSHRQHVSATETDAEYRKQLIQKLDEIIRLIEDVQRAESRQQTQTQETPEEPETTGE
jgi:uncharacterized membrane protein YukC